MIAQRKVVLIASLLVSVFALPGNVVFAADSPAISATVDPTEAVSQELVESQGSEVLGSQVLPAEVVPKKEMPEAAISASVPDTSASTALAAPPVVGSAVFDANPYTMVFSLIFVVALIFGLAWLMRRVGPGVFTVSQSMKVLAALPVGQREKAVLIEVGEQQLLLGVSAGRVTLLKDFEQPVVTHRASSGGEFSSKLKQFLHQQQTPRKSSSNNSSSDKSAAEFTADGNVSSVKK